MGRVIVTEFVSLDGVMEAPGGEAGYKHTGWVGRFPDVGQFQYKLEEVLAHEAHLLGRTTYESFAGAWPYREGEFADKINAMPKYVASTTLQNPEWNNTTVLQGDAMAAVARLKKDLKGDMLVAGSRTLVNSLKQHDLVDEYHLMVFPIILGSGMRLFDHAEDATTLTLIDTRPYENGIVHLTYQPANRNGS
jgi:dihydrofolate reductase